EEDCVNELARKMRVMGIIKCHHCGSSDSDHEHGERITKCRACGKPSWFTAGTLFHRMKTVRPLMIAIYIMERGLITNAFKFHNLVGIVYSSAWGIFKKITTVVQNQMDDDASGVPSSLFAMVFCKRSRMTPARKLPRSEQDDFDFDSQSTH